MGGLVRSVIDAVASSWLPMAAGVLFGAFMTATLCIGVWQAISAWSGGDPPRVIASIDVWKLGMVVGTSGTATAFLVTLYVTAHNYRRSREHIPSLSLKLRVKRVPASAKYDAVFVSLDARNTGTGLCDVDEVRWSIKAMSPYDDQRIDELTSEFKDKENVVNVEFGWDALDYRTSLVNLGIEPNETDQMTYDAIIPAEVAAIVVSAYVQNASEPKETEGWYRRIAHSSGKEHMTWTQEKGQTTEKK